MVTRPPPPGDTIDGAARDGPAVPAIQTVPPVGWDPNDVGWIKPRLYRGGYCGAVWSGPSGFARRPLRPYLRCPKRARAPDDDDDDDDDSDSGRENAHGSLSTLTSSLPPHPKSCNGPATNIMLSQKE